MVEEEADLEVSEAIEKEFDEVPHNDLPEPTLEVNPADFVYDEKTDTVSPKNQKNFDDLVQLHPTVHKLKRGDTRDKKVENLKTKVLQTLKVVERRRRDLSCESVKSSCSLWDQDEQSKTRDLSTESRGSVRQRSSDSEEDLPKSKKAQHQSRSRRCLQPPKILLTKQ